MATLTLEDLEASEVGQGIIRRKQAEAAAEAAEAGRQQTIAAWATERATLADLYTALQEAVVGKVAALAENTEQLGRLLHRIRELDSFVQKAGGDVPFSVKLDGPAKRKLSGEIRMVAQRLVARL